MSSSAENPIDHTAAEPTLLIVDDAQMMRLKIERLAEAAGWKRITQASDGGQAVELYRSQRFHLVTMDIVMPGMDGLEALTQIRGIDDQAKVVMVSAVNQKAKLRECIDAGAIDFVVKPFDASRFESFLAQLYQAALKALASET